jgi:hypothetical protein
MTLLSYDALRIIRAIKYGSSSPVVVETPGGRFLVKLRGAAQGVPPLIAEIIVAELAGALGLPVPERVLVTLDETVPSDDRNDELGDLLARSRGTNLGFRFLDGATDLRGDMTHLVDADMATLVLWLDGLVMNPDRTLQNPNVLLWKGRPWLIDHGSSLPFHYDWARVSEQSPRERGFALEHHLFHRRVEHLSDVDTQAARIVTRDVLTAAAGAVPTSFLSDAFAGEPPERKRAAYVAFLWKRLRAPRPFLE